MVNQRRVERLVVRLGRLLSKFSFVAGTLGIYIVLSLLIYLWLVVELRHWTGDAAVIAYDVSLGGSPLPYCLLLSEFPYLWKALEVFHFFAWLIVPVLAATMVDAAYRMFEENQRRKERQLRRSIGRWGKQMGYEGDELRDLVDEAMDTFPLRLKAKRRKKRGR
jgi:hypothetical protein